MLREFRCEFKIERYLKSALSTGHGVKLVLFLSFLNSIRMSIRRKRLSPQLSTITAALWICQENGSNSDSMRIGYRGITSD